MSYSAVCQNRYPKPADQKNEYHFIKNSLKFTSELAMKSE